MPTTDIEDHNDIQLADGVTAYHGSPHEFEEFDLSKVGTGEAEIYGGKEGHIGGKGAEYGHGIYLTDSEDTANHYKEKLSKPGQGYLYEVNIAPKKENFLNWAKTLSEQDSFVRDALINSRINKKIPPQIEIEANYKNIDPLDHYRNVLDSTTGEQFYKSEASMHGNTAKASSALNNLGIPGVIVPHGEQSNSYVIFDPKHIKTVRRYAEGGGIKAFAIGNSIPHLEQASDMIDTHDDIQLAPGVEAIDEMPDQAFTSENTSRNQIPALFNSPAFERKRGSRNLDYGGGAFDRGSEYLSQEHGVDSQVYDPFNREKEHNDFVLKGFKKEPADTATVANVLNVIAEPEARLHVIKQVHNHIKPDGKAYFTVYEGDGKNKNSGNSQMTRDGWQEYRPTHSYVEEIKQVFPDVRLSGKTIVASKKAAKAYGGAIIPGPKLTEENADDFARRLIAWSFATAPLFHRADGGAVEDPVATAVDTARQINPMGFYSAAAEAASKFPQKAPIDQIINKIKGQPNVKKEELDNANLADAFAGQRSVDPKEVARHLQENVPRISEKVYSNIPDEQFRELRKKYARSEYGDHYHDLPSEWKRKVDDLIRDRHGNPSYEKYTIPGGKNYREIVMTLPPSKGSEFDPSKLKINRTRRSYTQGNAELIYDGTPIGNFEDKIELNPQTGNYEVAPDDYWHDVMRRRWGGSQDLNIKSMDKGQNYRSSHWSGVTNPIAHLRMSDRDDGKTLHLEELQSDWGQEAQKIRKQEIKRIVKEKGIDKKEASKLVSSDFGFKDPNEKKADSLLDQMIQDFSFKLPRAPYVTDTGQWVDLGLKRALMEAAKGGYDKLIWTPGEEQANRYNLRKHVEALSYDPEDKVLSYLPHGGNKGRGYIDIPEKIEPHEIEEHIGKEAAERLLATEPNKLSGNHNLSGEDLEVGGEGMQAFYDKLVPQRLNKLIAQYDPEAKVQLHSHKVTIPGETGQKLTALRTIDPTNSSGYEDKDVMAHAIQITPKLREAILKGGLPAFEHGGSVIDAALDVVSKLRR